VQKRAKTAEPIDMPSGIWTQVGPGKHVLEGGPDPPQGKDHFWWGGGMSDRYSEYAASAMQKQLNRPRCSLAYEVGWAREPSVKWGPGTTFGGHTWTCPDVSSVNILNASRKGATAMRHLASGTVAT